MNYTELSLEKLKRISIEAAKRIRKGYDIDLIIYVAKAGFPIALYMKEVFDVQLLGIAAQRKGNRLKAILGPVVSHMPRFVRDGLITIELKSKVHSASKNRNVDFHKSIEKIDTQKYRTILIVDDSVDSGHSMRCVSREVKKRFPYAAIVSYSLNVWDESEDVFKTDFFSYRNTVIRAPMSKDSKEYKKFCKMYMEAVKEDCADQVF